MKKINSTEFSKEVLEQPGVVLVDFYTEWCGYCQLLIPEFEQVEKELPNLKIVKVDAEENPYLASQYEVTFYPLMLIFKNGQLVDHIDGYVKKDMIISKVEVYM